MFLEAFDVEQNAPPEHFFPKEVLASPGPKIAAKKKAHVLRLKTCKRIGAFFWKNVCYVPLILKWDVWLKSFLLEWVEIWIGSAMWTVVHLRCWFHSWTKVALRIIVTDTCWKATTEALYSSSIFGRYCKFVRYPLVPEIDMGSGSPISDAWQKHCCYKYFYF